MMLKKIIAGLFFLYSTIETGRAEEHLLSESEKIGEFSEGMSAKKLKKKLHCAFKLDKEIMTEADGLYHQTWDCPALGIRFDMSSGRKGGDKTINQITIVAPSQLKTGRGIQIGSTEQQVIKAYNDVKDVQGTVPHETFVAGSVYGGLFFQFKNGKVDSIMLGAGAE